MVIEAEVEKLLNAFFIGCSQERQILEKKIKELKEVEDVRSKLIESDKEFFIQMAEGNLLYIEYAERVIKHLISLKADSFLFITYMGIYMSRFELNVQAYNGMVDVTLIARAAR